MPRPAYRGFRPDRLRELRERDGYTQEYLSQLVRVFPSMIGKYERGEVVPGVDNIVRLAEVFGVRPQEFTSVPLERGSLVDLRVWSGRIRKQAAVAAGISERRLLAFEHLTLRPPRRDAQALAELYDVTPEVLLAAWDRDRAALFPGLTGTSPTP